MALEKSWFGGNRGVKCEARGVASAAVEEDDCVGVRAGR